MMQKSRAWKIVVDIYRKFGKNGIVNVLNGASLDHRAKCAACRSVTHKEGCTIVEACKLALADIDAGKVLCSGKFNLVKADDFVIKRTYVSVLEKEEADEMEEYFKEDTATELGRKIADILQESPGAHIYLSMEADWREDDGTNCLYTRRIIIGELEERK